MKNLIHSAFVMLFIAFLCTSTLYAQSVDIKLSTRADSSSNFRVLNSTDTVRMQVNSDGGFYLGGNFGEGVIPSLSKGSRLIWHPRKAAFRAGYVDGSEWDNPNIGTYSIATGISTMASGSASVAMGVLCTANGLASAAIGNHPFASGNYSIAMGYYPEANGNYSTALGSVTHANGIASTAIGYMTTAGGDYSTAMGYQTSASANLSTAMGYLTTASGIGSTAMGAHTTASGYFSTAIGCGVSTNNMIGACIIGDTSTTIITNSSAVNEMTMRFSGGYRLFTNSAATVGCSLAIGGTSWLIMSDSTKKELFVPANGEYFLNSLSRLKLGSWNYIGQEPKSFRHYGPMAQEIFRYFGKDAHGTIGGETTIASADIDGIMMICLQALEKRTAELNTALDELKTEKEKVVQLQTSFDELKKEVLKMKNDIQSLTEAKTEHENDNITLNK
jgi:hypothetical protein